MAVRALIPAERLNIAHVNSVDGSTDYESGVEYKAGTVVTYNSNTYVANIDIADTDTDTPDAAPDKWGLCPNARSLVEGGEVADLETRVSALENTVGDETYGLVKDVDDLQDDVKGFILVKSNTIEVTASNDTIASLLGKLYDALVADKNAQSADYYHYVRGMTLPTYATLKNMASNLREYSSGIAYNYFGARLPNTQSFHISFLEHKATTTAFVMAKLSDAGTFTLENIVSETVPDDTKFSAIIEYYKQNE